MTKRRLSITQSAHSTKRFNVGKITFDDGMEGINSAISDLGSGGIDTAETIQQTTTMLDQLNEACANLLAIRAQALGKQAKFSKAISDASKAIETWPTLGQLYQITSALHIAHGKPTLAIKILENGLRATFPSDWPQLYDEREAAKRTLETKVDFVSTIPAEVTAKIFTFLNGAKGSFSCALVSRRWRAAVLGCPNLWTVAKFDVCPNEAFKLLPSVSSIVQELDISKLRELPTQRLIALATYDKLQSVTKLKLGHFRSYIDSALLLALGEQVTELKIDATYDRTQYDALSLNKILATCQNLKALTILYVGRRVLYQPSQLANTETLELEMLSIYAPFDDGGFLQQLIPQCAQLRFLNIAHCPRDTLGLIAEPGSQLEEICITTADDSRQEIWQKEYQKAQQPTAGLRRLEFISGERNIRLRDLMPLWIKWKNTLHELIIEMCDDDIATMELTHWDSLTSGTYSKLKSLLLVSTDGNGSHVANQVLKLLQSCPVLEEVSLYIENMTSDDLFTRFGALPCLRRLRISYLDTCGGLQQCFEYLSTRGQACNLKEISITSCEAVDDQILYALAGIPSLEDIRINGQHVLVSSSGIKAFLQKLKSNPNLTHLALRNMTNYTKDCMAELDELVELDRADNKCSLVKYTQDGMESHSSSRYDVVLDRKKYL
ncbi:hypothetical protein BJV82DRAFT_666544 [Fennellomyces sp. T-0311]|nr:hypothetical protein BJV82DRAFT_666544 [Fennellomyces sp. T-0311]